MDLLTLKRDLPAIDDGRWVDSAELPGLLGIRVKVRGYSAKYVRERDQARRRAMAADAPDGKLDDTALEALGLALLQDAVVDIDGATIGDKTIDAEELRALLADPAFEPLASLVMRAVHIVDQSRVAKAEALTKN